MNARSILCSAVLFSSLFGIGIGSARATARLGTDVRSALSKGQIKVGPGSVDGVRAFGPSTVRIDMNTGKLAHPAGKDSYDLYQATAIRGAHGVRLSNVKNIGTVALEAARKSGKVSAASTMFIGDATGKKLGEFSGKSIRIGTFTQGAAGQVVHGKNLLVVLSATGDATRVIAEHRATGK